MNDHDETKITEQNLTVRSSKSEAEVTNNRRLRSIVLLEALRGLSEIARDICTLQTGCYDCKYHRQRHCCEGYQIKSLLPRDKMSVRSSVTRRYYVDTAE